MIAQAEQEKQGRNDLCTCDSGLKYKKCHGDSQKLQIVKHVANEAMLIMIARAKVKNTNIEFDEEDYEAVVDNPEFVLPKFIEQFLS